jgi:hypothetical protein
MTQGKGILIGFSILSVKIIIGFSILSVKLISGEMTELLE